MRENRLEEHSGLLSFQFELVPVYANETETEGASESGEAQVPEPKLIGFDHVLRYVSVMRGLPLIPRVLWPQVSAKTRMRPPQATTDGECAGEDEEALHGPGWAFKITVRSPEVVRGLLGDVMCEYEGVVDRVGEVGQILRVD